MRPADLESGRARWNGTFGQGRLRKALLLLLLWLLLLLLFSRSLVLIIFFIYSSFASGRNLTAAAAHEDHYLAGRSGRDDGDRDDDDDDDYLPGDYDDYEDVDLASFDVSRLDGSTSTIQYADLSRTPRGIDADLQAVVGDVDDVYGFEFDHGKAVHECVGAVSCGVSRTTSCGVSCTTSCGVSCTTSQTHPALAYAWTLL